MLVRQRRPREQHLAVPLPNKIDRPREGRESLLKYEKDDREPFPAVFKLFAGTTSGKEILEGIAAARISDSDRQSRLFYADLYIGLNHAVQDRPAEAREPQLAQAVKNEWPHGGYGRGGCGRSPASWEQLEAKRHAATTEK